MMTTRQQADFSFTLSLTRGENAKVYIEKVEKKS